jgi:hypothetical protein
MGQFSGRFVYLWNSGKVAKYGIGKRSGRLVLEARIEVFMNGPTRRRANDIP